ncbi:CGI-121-domain-containing protein [Glonium stellatum]|uniref:EKC/KEOPS complex subunit CGI121 n=1 Tax=Glonium stellatum TaxID=574774 RepID=A0A8E2FAL4_9PEZI|nr:CGI-121-domain-containing protein [Glonium stellatum]
MALVQTFHLPHFPAHPTYISLFRDVENVNFLRQQLLEANAEFEYAFLDATMILSTTHVLAAVFRALNDMLNNRLKSRNVHSEVVFSLSPNNNIAESFRRFGINDTTRTLLAIKISTNLNVTAEGVERHLSSSITGVAIPFTNDALADITDLAKVRRIYKLDTGNANSNGSAGKKGKRDKSADERIEIESVVLGIMALKGS